MAAVWDKAVILLGQANVRFLRTASQPKGYILGGFVQSDRLATHICHVVNNPIISVLKPLVQA